MNIQIKHRVTAEVLFEHDCENNSTRVTLECANLARANLARAYLEGANLEGANLARVYLGGANLEGANLEGANLKNKEKLIGRRPIFQIGPIGSRCAYFVAYITDQGLRFDAGCQKQITREVFEQRLADTHDENEHAAEYRAALALIDVHAEIWTPKSAEDAEVSAQEVAEVPDERLEV